MKRKALGIAVVLAALAVLINVFALQSAKVNNDLSFTIANTSSALIAITSTGIDSDVTFNSSNGYATLTLPAAGFQPKSEYVFAPVFNVKNNSGASRNITLTQAALPDGVSISFTKADGITPFDGNGLAAGGSFAVGIKITLDNTVDFANDAGSHTVNITVGAN